MTVYDPIYSFNQTPQNVEITISLGETDAIILGADWNTRMKALPGYKGNLGQADLNNFPGGALPWFKERLQAPRGRNVSQIFLAQHQPLKCPWFIPNMAFCFSNDDQDAVRAAMRTSSYPESTFWGNLAGHLHEWNWNAQVFPDDGKGYPNFKQFETSACKGNQDTIEINSAIAIVPFD